MWGFVTMEQIGQGGEQPQQPMQGVPAKPSAPACSFRVSHSSGETICADLETARGLLRLKPGAKIFLHRG